MDTPLAEIPDSLNILELWKQILVQIRITWPVHTSRAGESLLHDQVVPLDYQLNTLVLAVADEETRQIINHCQPNLYWLLAEATANAQTMAGQPTWARDVSVQIVVDPRQFNPPEETSSQGQADNSVKIPDDFIEIDIHSDTYTRIVQPKRVITIPAGMFRWLPILGPLRASMVVSLYQKLYLLNRTRSIEVGIRELSMWAGMNKETFQLHMNDPELRSFFSLSPRTGVEKEYAVDPESGRVKRLANRYVVSMTLPLPPGDELALIEYLENTGVQEDPEKAIKKAAGANVKDILPDKYSPAPAGWTEWMGDHTVNGIVHRLIGNRELSSECEKWITTLANRLMPENKNSVNIPWYRFQKWFPILGQERGWFTILCDWKTYHNEDLNEIRDTFQIPGYEWFAGYLGMNDRTVRLWFQFNDKTNRRHGITDNLTRFVRINEVEKKQNKATQIRVRVVSHEPMIPNDEESFNQELVTNPYNEVKNPVTKPVNKKYKSVTNPYNEPQEPVSDPVNKTKEPVSKPDNVVDKPVTNPYNLNYLKPLNYPENKDKLPTATTPRENNKPVVVDSSEWDIKSILQRLTRNPSKVAELINKQINLTTLLSLLIYAASPAGERLGAGYIVKSLEGNASPGDPFDRLARTNKEDLLFLIKETNQAYSIPQDTEEYNLWKKAGMNNAGPEKIKELMFRLTGE